MSIHWDCDLCGEPLAAADSKAGKTGRCNSCQAIVRVPDQTVVRYAPVRRRQADSPAVHPLPPVVVNTGGGGGAALAWFLLGGVLVAVCLLAGCLFVGAMLF